MGEDRNGDGRGDIDLIADGTYDRVDGNGVGITGKQGINGFIWALITVDSMFYEIPGERLLFEGRPHPQPFGTSAFRRRLGAHGQNFRPGHYSNDGSGARTLLQQREGVHL